MRLLLDAHLSPGVAAWINETFAEIQAASAIGRGLQGDSDSEICGIAGREYAVIMTKDADFAQRAIQGGSTPSVIWLRCGNCSNQAIRQVLADQLPRALQLIRAGQRLIEIR